MTMTEKQELKDAIEKAGSWRAEVAFGTILDAATKYAETLPDEPEFERGVIYTGSHYTFFVGLGDSRIVNLCHGGVAEGLASPIREATMQDCKAKYHDAFGLVQKLAKIMFPPCPSGYRHTGEWRKVKCKAYVSGPGWVNAEPYIGIDGLVVTVPTFHDRRPTEPRPIVTRDTDE